MNESPQRPRVLGNRYEVGDLLGRGGMAEVHLGRDTRLGRVVAIKLLRTDLARDPMFQARFRREAQSAAGLNHPAIVAVYDTGEETVIESGGGSVSLPYIVMEYVEGRTLRDVLREGRPLEVQPSLEVSAGVLSALDYSHRMGIVHRDIKPANVMLTASGDVKVMDFGIARALADVSATMTQTQAVIGTAQYLSPEQARGETVDARSDLYSAGCLLFELMTGRPPFVADSPVAVAYQHVRELPQPPSAFNPVIPEVVDRIVLHALAKDREARYQTAAEFRADIEAAASGRAVMTAAASTVALTPQQQAGSQPQPGPSGAATEFLGQQGGYQATRTMPQNPVGVGAPPQQQLGGPEGDGLYSRRADRRGQAGYGPDGYGGQGDGGRRLGFIALAVAVVVLFAGAAYGVSSLAKRNSPANAAVAVPRLVGLKQAAALEQLKAKGLSAVVLPEASEDVEQGLVTRTDPVSGVERPKGTEIKVYVSSGTSTVKIPPVKGLTEAQARAKLKTAGLTVAEVTDTVAGGSLDKGLVVGTNPAAAQEVDRGSQVVLQVASGKVTVPNVVNKSKDDAIALLNKAGIATENITVVLVPSDQPANQVIDQDPKGSNTPREVKEVSISVAVPNQQTDTGQPDQSQTDGNGDGQPDQTDQNNSPGGDQNGQPSPTQ